MRQMRIHWVLKAVLPVAGVLLLGVLVFLWVTISLEDPARRGILLVALGGAGVICGVLLVVLVILIQQPLLELQKKIGQLRTGDLTVAASFAERKDDIGELGRNFNEMVRQLRITREEMDREHSAEMSRAEHLATLGELAAGVAHEIRNPLAGIAGVIELLGQELPESSPARDVWKDAKQEVQQIQKILSDLLDYARPRPPQCQPGDLNRTVELAVHLAQQQVLSRPIQVHLVKASGLAPVEHDAAQVQQVLLNLLLNALQAIDGAGTVEVRVESRGPFAAVSVADTGRGIDPSHLAMIFRPFFTTKGRGTGLGLSLAQRITEGHGGRIQVSSTPGKGSRFIVELPFHAAAKTG